MVVGFSVEVERTALVAEVFPDLRTIFRYTERDLKDVVKEFRERTIDAGQINIVPRVRVQRLAAWFDPLNPRRIPL
jgi:hypothetical protein